MKELNKRNLNKVTKYVDEVISYELSGISIKEMLDNFEDNSVNNIFEKDDLNMEDLVRIKYIYKLNEKGFIDEEKLKQTLSLYQEYMKLKKIFLNDSNYHGQKDDLLAQKYSVIVQELSSLGIFSISLYVDFIDLIAEENIKSVIKTNKNRKTK